MIDEPMLASRRLPPGTDGYRVPRIFAVYGGLHQLGGNARPYFSLTCWAHRVGFPNQCESGGADHEAIARWFPGRFDDLAALHLSDPDGVPMHAEANGWYQLAGALGGAGERFHAGNAETYGRPRDPLAAFARHCRISMEEAEGIRAQTEAAAHHQDAPDWGAWETNTTAPDWAYARTIWRALMEAMRPRWKAEAEAAIARHHLRVYTSR